MQRSAPISWGIRTWGLISKKKKKKGQHLFGGTYYVIFGPNLSPKVQVKRWWPFFFFLEITPFFFNFEASPLLQKSGLELNLNVPILLKKLMKRPYIWSRAKWPSIVPIFAIPDMVTLHYGRKIFAIFDVRFVIFDYLKVILFFFKPILRSCRSKFWTAIWNEWFAVQQWHEKIFNENNFVNLCKSYVRVKD